MQWLFSVMSYNTAVIMFLRVCCWVTSWTITRPYDLARPIWQQIFIFQIPGKKKMQPFHSKVDNQQKLYEIRNIHVLFFTPCCYASNYGIVDN